jgi:N-acetylneuraminate synthase
MFNQVIKIDKKNVGLNNKPYVIAELSGNHGHSFEQVMQMILTAKECGADAIKLQTLRPEGITIDCNKPEFLIQDKSNPWYGNTLYELYSKSYLPREWYADIFSYCKKLAITCFSTPFDLQSIDFLEEFNVPCYKIGSSENIDLPLIKKAANTGKPLIISLGLASLSEIEDVVNTVKACGCKDLILMICTCCYPAPSNQINLKTIPHLRDMFGVNVGFSDHTLGIGAATASVALGAVAIEKHFMLEKSVNALDSCFSANEHEFKSLVKEIDNAWDALGTVFYGVKECEIPYLANRRSIYVIKDIQAGELITSENIQSVRPGWGLSPKHFDAVIGKSVNCDIQRGEPVLWEKINN